MNARWIKAVFSILFIITFWMSSASGQTGSLLVVIQPPDAISEEAMWRVDEGSWQESGTLIPGLPTGDHIVEFQKIPGWISPSPVTVTISENSTEPVIGTYAGWANTYYATRGFDLDDDGQVDFVNTGQVELLAAELPDQPEVYLQSNLGGMTAPMAYYPNVLRELTDEGLEVLIGSDTFERPQPGSALEFRTVLYSTSGVNALKAFYTNAIQSFTPKLLKVL